MAPGSRALLADLEFTPVYCKSEVRIKECNKAVNLDELRRNARRRLEPTRAIIGCSIQGYDLPLPSLMVLSSSGRDANATAKALIGMELSLIAAWVEISLAASEKAPSRPVLAAFVYIAPCT